MAKSPVEPAPSFNSLLNEFSNELPRLIQISQDLEDPYRHWSQIKYKNPPHELNHRQWWLALMIKRSGTLRPLPFKTTTGEPFVFNLTDSILRTTDTLTRNLASNAQPAELRLPDGTRPKFIVKQLVEEAITSSQLEGATTSRRVAKEMLSTGRPPQNKSEMMIFNNYRAMEFVSHKRNDALTPEFVLELHRIISEDTLEFPDDAGQLQQPEDTRVAIYHNEHIVHSPPPAEDLPARLDVLCRFANEDTHAGTYIPDIVRAIILHFMIGYDHYFADGNGRTARTVFLWYMLKKGFTLMEYVSISNVLKQDPRQYINSYLYSEDEGQDVTYFINFQLKVLQKSVDKLFDHLLRKIDERKIFLDQLEIEHQHLNHRQIAMVKELYEHPDTSITAQTFAHEYRISTQTARNDLEALVEANLVVRHKQGRSHSWKIHPQMIS